MRKIYSLLLLLFISQFSLFAEEISLKLPKDQQNEGIQRIEVVGLKRTKDEYIQSLLEKYIGMESEKIDVGEVETSLQATGLFTDISIEIEEDRMDESVLYINLTEKWSFLPIPFFAYTDDGAKGGGFVMDTNAFGRNNMLMAGGSFSAESYTVIGLFVKGALRPEVPGYTIITTLSSGTEGIKDEEDATIVEYDFTRLSGGFSLIKKITENTSIGSGIRYAYWTTEHPWFDPARIFSAHMEAKYEKQDWNGWFLLNSSLEGELAYSFDVNNLPFASVSIMARGERALLDRMRLITKAALYYAEASHISTYKSQKEAGVAIMPEDFKSEKMLGASGGFEIGVSSTALGLVSVYSVYQGFLAQNFDEDTFWNHGPSFGGRLYLKKIALPAVSLGAAFNVTTNRWNGSASFGFSY